MVKGSKNGKLSSRGDALVEMASRYGLDRIVKLSLEQCSRNGEGESTSENLGRKRNVNQAMLQSGSQGSQNVEEGYSKETSSWSCKICMNTFMTKQGFFRHAKRNKSTQLCWSCIKCNDSEAFPTVCKALLHFSYAAATGSTELECHKSFRCILCQYVCNGKKELLSHDCSRPGETIGRPKELKAIKEEPDLDDSYNDFGDGDENVHDEDYKPDMDGLLPLPNAFLNLSNDDFDTDLGALTMASGIGEMLQPAYLEPFDPR